MTSTVLVLAIGLAVFLLLASSLYALARTGVPVKHTPPEAIDAACRIAELREGEQVLDVGTGNGRFLVHVLRRHPVTAVGWELSLPMVLLAKLRLLCAGLSGRGRVHWGDARRQDWSGADVIYGYLMPPGLPELREKLLREAKPGARFLSYAFPVPGWTPSATAAAGPRKHPVFLYRMNDVPRTA